MDLASATVAERALLVLAELADADGHVASTGKTLGPRLGVSATTANRAILRLERDGAVAILRAGGRTGPTVLKVLREPDPALTRIAAYSTSSLAVTA